MLRLMEQHARRQPDFLLPPPKAEWLSPVSEDADGARLPWEEAEAAGSRPLWQRCDTTPGRNAVELLNGRLAPDQPATPLNRGLSGLN
jgi:hypothetical protein